MGEDRILELLLGNLGTLVLALLIIWAFLRGWIVPGWAYKAKTTECERWFNIAVPSVRALEQGTSALRERRSES